MVISLTPLTTHFGAEMTGVDITRPLSDTQFGKILAAFDEYSVLVLPNQPMTDDRQIDFSERFGILEGTRVLNPGSGTPFARQSNLDINTGDFVSITTSDIKTTLLGSFPQSIKLKVVGLYELRSELDQALVLISHSLAQKIKIIDSSSTYSIRLKTDDLFMADKIARDAFYTIEDNLISNNYFEVVTWKSTHGTSK